MREMHGCEGGEILIFLFFFSTLISRDGKRGSSVANVFFSFFTLFFFLILLSIFSSISSCDFTVYEGGTFVGRVVSYRMFQKYVQKRSYYSYVYTLLIEQNCLLVLISQIILQST